MKDIPKRVSFDTNVYIIGVVDLESVEREVLTWAVFDGTTSYLRD